MPDELDVRLYGTRIGTLHRDGHDVVFESSPEAIDRFGLSSPMLSASLPFSTQRSSAAKATAFVGGLFPEGRGLTNMARQAGCSSRDVFSLAEYAGGDVAGAVMIGSDSHGESGYEALTPSEISDRLHRVNDYAMGSMSGGGSLAGYQPKTTLALINNQWHAGLGGAPSTHILKPAALEAEPHLHAEAYTLALSRDIGLSSFDSWMERFGDRSVLVIERYDRAINEDGIIERIHQEDAAQALALPWHDDSKFQSENSRSCLRNVASLLTRRRTIFGSGTDDRETLLAFTTFNVATGNTDAHAKNFSMLHHSDGTVTLAPLYDISTHALSPDGQQNMAMHIAGKSYQPDVTREALITEGESWGLPADRCRTTVDDTLEQLRYAIEETDPGQASERTGHYIAVQAQNLLDGKRAAVSNYGPPSLAQLHPPARMPARTQDRVPRGIPSGGQFSSRQRPESELRLSGPTTP